MGEEVYQNDVNYLPSWNRLIIRSNFGRSFPQEETHMSATSSVPRPWFIAVAFAMVLSLLASGLTIATAQESSIPEGAPVDIHSGTCADIVAEPAYDGGDIALTTTDDMWDDETFQTGIFEDDQLQASGVDFNNDGQLQEEEIITPHGVSVEMGHAEGDLGSDVNTDEPYVVVVHASSDAYDTYIACGTIDGGQQVDGGETLIYLQPLDEFNFFGYAVLSEGGDTLNTYLFEPNTQPLEGGTPVGEQLDFQGYPVAIHSGVCEDFTSEPMYDIGDFVETNVYAEGQQEAGDMEGDIPSEAENLGPVYVLQDEVPAFEGNILEEENPRVVAVHESPEQFGTVIACGQILNVEQDDNVVVFLHPVGASNHVGYLNLGQEGGEADGYLWLMQMYDMHEAAEADIDEGATPAPVATPAPQEEEEATPVAVETEIVVPEEQATAIVEGEEVSTPVADQEQTESEAVAIEIGGDEAVDIFASPGQTLMFSNEFENERTFRVSDLDMEVTLGSGEQMEETLSEDAEPGDYTYEVLEGDDVVYEGTLSVEG
jgi:hypothetical protein